MKIQDSNIGDAEEGSGVGHPRSCVYIDFTNSVKILGQFKIPILAVVSPDADYGEDAKVFSISTQSYYRICGYADGWTDAKSNAVCEILGFL